MQETHQDQLHYIADAVSGKEAKANVQPNYSKDENGLILLARRRTSTERRDSATFISPALTIVEVRHGNSLWETIPSNCLRSPTQERRKKKKIRQVLGSCPASPDQVYWHH
ncbi:hypothetical protein HispidOSU_006601 [Sigmodon hispidus]